MVLKDINGIKQTLVQVTSGNDGQAMGLYLIPDGVTIDQFERHFHEIGDQDVFDESNSLGVERIYAYDSILTF